MANLNAFRNQQLTALLRISTCALVKIWKKYKCEKLQCYIVIIMATVRVKEDTYRDLNALAGRLQTKLKRPVSVDEAIKYLLEREKLKPSDFAGA